MHQGAVTGHDHNRKEKDAAWTEMTTAAATYGGGCESRNRRQQPRTTATTNRGRPQPRTAAGTNGLSHERQRARIGETAAVANRANYGGGGGSSGEGWVELGSRVR
jgi:hypothetical protein